MKNNFLQGACLCGDVRYQSSQHHTDMWNCHCRSCRKASSVAYATWIKTRVSSFQWLAIKSPVSLYQSSTTMLRSFCSRCGSILPAYSEKENAVFLPASGIATEHDLMPSADHFIDEIPPWYNMAHHLPCLGGSSSQKSTVSEHGDQYAQRLDSKSEGSCLCGALRYSIVGEVDAIRACHCSRCRQRSGSAYFTGMPVIFSDFHIHGDEDKITSFFLPESKYYGYRFCNVCATLIPGVFPDGKRTVIAAGSLDSIPPVELMFHIYYASKAPWLNLSESARCFSEYPPSDFDQ